MPPPHGLRRLFRGAICVLEQLPLLLLVFRRCFSLLLLLFLLRLRLSFLLRSAVFLECLRLLLRFLVRSRLPGIVRRTGASSRGQCRRSTQNNQQRQDRNSFHADFPSDDLRFPHFIKKLSEFLVEAWLVCRARHLGRVPWECESLDSRA